MPHGLRLRSNCLQRRPRLDLSPGHSTATSHGAPPPRAGASRGAPPPFYARRRTTAAPHRHGLGHEPHRNTCAGWADDVAVRRDTNSYYVKVKLNPARSDARRRVKPPPGGAVVHSFTGKYLQVLPDNGTTTTRSLYESFAWTALEFRLKVPAADTRALRALVRRRHGRRRRLDVRDDGERRRQCRAPAAWISACLARCRLDGRNTGLFPLRSAACPRGETRRSVPATPRACSRLLLQTRPRAQHTEDAATAEAECTADGGYFQKTADAVGFGATCVAGEGKMEQLAPEWYEFAGQEYGNVMDFASEPWDATCEAQGTGTADSGRDEAVWQLAAGNYVLKFYPREDGTALDAIYLAPFNARNPDSVVLAPGVLDLRRRRGRRCGVSFNDDDDAADGPGRAAVAVGVVLVLLVVAPSRGSFSRPGRRFSARRAEATPRLFRDAGRGPSPPGLTVTTENKMLADPLPPPYVSPQKAIINFSSPAAGFDLRVSPFGTPP